MHSYSTNSPANPKLIGVLMLVAVAASVGVGWLAEQASALIGWETRGIVGLSGGLSAMTVFTAFYLIFDHAIWRFRFVRSVLLIPDLNGVWQCVGTTKFKNGQPQQYDWNGTIEIRQSWSRIVVVLKTATSRSTSIAASLYRCPGDGYRLIYHYDNTPELGVPELMRHCGLCDLMFDETASSAAGTYFTDKDRMTAGTMKLRREGAEHGQA